MDNTPCFPEFLSLPKELRESIYIHYLHSSPPGILTRPCEPSLTRVSRLLRAESLPLFYSSFPLTIQTFIKCASYGQVWLTTNQWYHKLSMGKLKHIRIMHLKFRFVEQYFGEPVVIHFNIELSKRFSSYSIHHTCGGASWWSDANRKGDPADCEEVVDVLKAHLKRCLEKLLLEPGIGEFEGRHIDQLVKVDPDELKKVSNI